MEISRSARMSIFSRPRSKLCVCSTTVVSIIGETSEDSSRIARGCAVFFAFSVGATKALAWALLSLQSALCSTAPTKSQRIHAPAATDARATKLPDLREPSTDLDPGRQWVEETAIGTPSL